MCHPNRRNLMYRDHNPRNLRLRANQEDCPTRPSISPPSLASPSLGTETALISKPFLFMSNLCLRCSALTNSRVALAIAPGKLDALTLAVDPSGPFLRS